MAFLNSAVMQYIFRKKFSTHKVLRGDLEKLPFPLIDFKTQNDIERLVDSATYNSEAPKRLDELVFSLFALNEEQILTIKQFLNAQKVTQLEEK